MSILTPASPVTEGIFSLRASFSLQQQLIRSSAASPWLSFSSLDGSGEPRGNNAAPSESEDPSRGSGPAISTGQEMDAALDAWGVAMEEGDWDRAWDIFESRFPVDTELFPTLEELLAWDPDSEIKAVRRQREHDLQEGVARARVSRIDGSGMAHGVGKRKTSVARVWIRQGPGHIMVNKRPYDAHFPELPRRNDLIAPLLVTGMLGKFDVMAAVKGGGQTGQAQAMRHGIARALQNWDPEMRPALKAAGLLARDARIVERKKPGLKKARKAFQWVKR